MATKQHTVMTLICQHIAARGVPPTMQELATALGVFQVTAFGHVKTLLRNGHLTRRAGSHVRNLGPRAAPALRLAKLVVASPTITDEMRRLADTVISQSKGVVERSLRPADESGWAPPTEALVVKEPACR